DRTSQPDIDQCEAWPVIRGQCQGLGSRGRDAGNPEAGFGEDLLDIGSDQRLVLDDQNAGRLAGVRFRDHLRSITSHGPLPYRRLSDRRKVLPANAAVTTGVPCDQLPRPAKARLRPLRKSLTLARTADQA